MIRTATRDVIRVIPCEARRFLGTATFIDVRNPQAWASSNEKIPGAIRIPLDECESRLAEIPNDRPIVVY